MKILLIHLDVICVGLLGEAQWDWVLSMSCLASCKVIHHGLTFSITLYEFLYPELLISGFQIQISQSRDLFLKSSQTFRPISGATIQSLYLRIAEV